MTRTLKTNKRGDVVFMPLLVIITLLAFTTMFVVVYDKNTEFESKIGDKQLSLEATELAAEKALFYLDVSAEYALQQAITAVFEGGGKTEATTTTLTQCGKHRGANVLFSKRKPCSVTISEFSAALNFHFNTKLNTFLQTYVDTNYPSLAIPTNNYVLQFRGDKVYGFAENDLLVPIYGKTNKEQIEKLNTDYFGGSCTPLEVETHSLDLLKQRYGSTEAEVTSQLTTISFMNKEVQVHEKVKNAFVCAQQDILKCDAGRNYPFSTILAFDWRPMVTQDTLSYHSFGIAMDINPKQNPMCPGFDPDGICEYDGQLITNLPPCVRDAFKRYGFRWGGDWNEIKDAMHFEFLADPEKAKDMIQKEQGTYTLPPVGAGWPEILEKIDKNFGDTIDKYRVKPTPEVSKSIVIAVIARESRGDPDAESHTGCKGLMQFCKGTADDYNLKDRFDPIDSIRAGTELLSHLLKKFEGFTDKHEFALASYNGGRGLINGAIQNAVAATGNPDPRWPTVSQYIDEPLIKKYYKGKYFAESKEHREQKVEEVRRYVPRVHAQEKYYSENFEGKASVVG
jgi:hypothetical protein